ncbi:unnamed protein product (macronuclear) [Paramecium tetraurelia]|uniref:Intimal thickness related receptor IRP domain-containing protein n=1 Tax=Paramecium tetraurelia TaxID=5888 RepID=A0DRA4_PARTE|nr:uncharacterized protein GSPATT00019288001 [Paramecium tetraurelia]CAK85571.1 unnamed protein product [Paramecium tetraurelia]|eukprot:XP_001452968.1 hypothetical protein (macronuclear) [Paramecium tetraurelia strain d4-2]
MQEVTCKPPKSFGVNSTSSLIGYSNQTLRIQNDDIVSFNVVVQQATERDTSIALSTEVVSEDGILKPKSEIKFLLYQMCPQKVDLTPENYWTPILVNVTINQVSSTNKDTIEFAMIFTCDKAFRDKTFDWSLPILLIITTILIAFLAKHTRIISFKWRVNGHDFQGFEIGFMIIGIYILAYASGATIVIATAFSDLIRYSLIVIACTIGTLAIFFLSTELACLLKANSFIRKYNLIIAAVISLLIGLPYYFWMPWYLNDIISLAFIFLIVKFFRLKNLKTAAALMFSNMILDSTFAIYIHYTQDLSYNTTVLQYLNCPLELQLPLMKLQYDKNCAWISLFSQAVPGLFLSLAYRIDRSKRTFTYGLAGVMSLIISEGFWVLATVSVKHSIPQSLFTYPIMLGALTLNSIRRAEFSSYLFGDYLFDQSYYRLRGISLEDCKEPQFLLNMESLPDIKTHPTDL